MKKIGLTGGLLILIRMVAFTQVTPGEMDASLLPFLNMHYNAEYTFDIPINKQAWVSQKSGLHVSLGSTDIAYFRTEVPVQKATLLWKPIGWRGERLNTEILIWSPDTLNQVRVTLTDLVNAKGVVINRKSIRQ